MVERAVIIDTPEGIAAAQFLARYHALKLEAKGFKRRGRAMWMVCQEAYKIEGGKKDVMKWMNLAYDELMKVVNNEA